MSVLTTPLEKCQHKRQIAESRFDNIINNSLDGILIVSDEGSILFSNPAAATLFGCAQEELHGAPFGFPLVGADRAELDIPLPAGQVMIVEMRVAETEWDGHLAFLTQLRDITHRKQLEESLRLAAKVFENSTEAIIILDSRMKFLSGNQAFTDMTGYTSEDIINKESTTLWSDRYGMVSFQQMFSNALQSRGRWQGEVICHSKKGLTFPGWLSAVVVRDGLSMVTHYVVIFSDISERKANENALRLAAVVFEQTVEAVFVLDNQERFLSVNRSFETVTGYTAEEVIGRTPRILKSGRQDAVFYRSMWRQINEHGHWQGEIWNRRKSGEVYPEWLSVSEVRNEQGNIENYIGIFSDITERKRQEEHIKQLAFFDPLTRLANRTLLMDRMKNAVANAERHQKGLAVIFIDLNRFKEINDHYGHDIGDDVLITSAERFANALRQGETLARLGGDEFVIIVETSDLISLEIIAERLQHSLSEKCIEVRGFSLTVSMSAGIALYPTDGETSEELLKYADIAMYRAKKKGGGYCFYQAEMSKGLAERLMLADRFSMALANNTLQLYFQPQVNLSTGELIGAEALLRWFDEIYGWVSPVKFIALAEERGMIHDVGAWVMRTALLQLCSWRKMGLLIPGRLSINVSAQEIESPNFPERLREAYAEAGSIELELTEGSLINNVDSVLENLKALREHQFSLAIDDFGTGYSSLGYLTRFPVQKLKIDCIFVRNLLQDAKNRSIIGAIIAMAHSLGLQVIAEGIEDVYQANALLEMGCDFGQGFYYGHAESADVFVRRLGKNNLS